LNSLDLGYRALRKTGEPGSEPVFPASS
jgi:hypothetical protein